MPFYRFAIKGIGREKINIDLQLQRAFYQHINCVQLIDYLWSSVAQNLLRESVLYLFLCVFSFWREKQGLPKVVTQLKKYGSLYFMVNVKSSPKVTKFSNMLNIPLHHTYSISAERALPDQN